jgi:hypothetical protein
MPPPVIFHPLAKRELQEAALYYEDQLYGLGTEFRTEVREFLDRIISNPLRYSIRTAEVRRANLKRFPTISITYCTAGPSPWWRCRTTGGIHSTGWSGRGTKAGCRRIEPRCGRLLIDQIAALDRPSEADGSGKSIYSIAVRQEGGKHEASLAFFADPKRKGDSLACRLPLHIILLLLLAFAVFGLISAVRSVL